MSAEIREQRLQEGCCPSCGVQLYKIISKKANVMSKMSMFNNKSQDTSSNYPKMEPLNIPGVVERGQCVKCANGNTTITVSSSDVVGDTFTSSSPIAIGEHMTDVAAPVKAAPVTISPPFNNDNNMARKPPPSSPAVGNLKQPPEILGLKAQQATMKKEAEESSSSGSEEESDSDNSSYYTTSSGDGESLEDVDMLIDTQMHRLESDQASSDLVNTLKKNATFNASGQVGDYIPGKGGSDTVVDSNGIIIDDRKPAAKPTVEESSDQLRKLQLEAAAIDMACLEATNRKPQDDTKKLQCPSGMSPDVFYELPPEMQKEVLAQETRKSSNAADIDPETLASLPDNIRQEVLEQARREQQQNVNSTAAAAATSSSIDRLEDMKKHKLSASTTAFLSDCDINAEDYEKFPEEVKNDIMKEKKRRDSKTSIEPLGQAQLEDLDTSGYDRETLASLPEELRNEVLEEERRKKEKKRRESQASGNRPSTVGAHSVSNVPAGYDPETFAELPEEMKRELLDDAARRQQSGGGRYSADGYDYESIVDAQVVSAQPMRSGGGTATSCTYEGEYNIMGKRHGDGELKWANGDKYVGKFKNGYIDGRGTINFHDGKFVLHF